MTTLTIGRNGPSPWPARLQRARRRVKEVAAAALVAGRHPALKNLASIPLTLGMFGCLDAAAFTHSVFAGLIVTGVSLGVLERMIEDGE